MPSGNVTIRISPEADLSRARLASAVTVHRGRERGGRLVGERAAGPQRAGLVDELLELRAGVAEPRGCAERVALGPLQIVDRRLGHLGGHLGPEARPRRVGFDRLGWRELGDQPQADVGAGGLGAVRERRRDLVDVAGGRVVDDRDACHLRRPPDGGRSSQ